MGVDYFALHKRRRWADVDAWWVLSVPRQLLQPIPGYCPNLQSSRRHIEPSGFSLRGRSKGGAHSIVTASITTWSEVAEACNGVKRWAALVGWRHIRSIHKSELWYRDFSSCKRWSCSRSQLRADLVFLHRFPVRFEVLFPLYNLMWQFSSRYDQPNYSNEA